MIRSAFSEFTLIESEPQTRFFREAVRGLGRVQKELPAKYFYDDRGSLLFERISELPEYYLTRIELELLERNRSQISEVIGTGALLVEYGSGSSTKTRLLLDELQCPCGYVPIDISRQQLLETARDLEREYAGLQVLPICADFTAQFALPRPSSRPARKVVFYPGSTIGNFSPVAARRMLREAAELCGRGGGMLLGVDLVKSRPVLERAYNDSSGVTAEFNLNLLARMNRELGADFVLDQFRHHAFYDARRKRIEMHLVSRCQQEVTVGDVDFEFEPEETIHTENSYKYTLDDLHELVASAGWRPMQTWLDKRRWFSLNYLEVA